jgi:hypothetical protein
MIFDGCVFVLRGRFSIPTDQMEQLITDHGGRGKICELDFVYYYFVELFYNNTYSFGLESWLKR